MSNFEFVGHIRPMKNGFDVKDFDSGWRIERCKFIVSTETNSHIVEINAGRWQEDSKNEIYAMSRKTATSPSTKIKIPWSKRNDEKTIETVAGWRIFTVDLDTMTHRKEVKDSGDDEAIAASQKKEHHFIAGTDFCEFVDKLTKNDKIKNVKFRIRGNVNYTYSAKDDRYYSNYEVTKIYRVDDDTPFSDSMTIPFYFGTECFDMSMFEESNFARLSGYTDFYDNTDKKNYFCPLNIVVRFPEKATKRWGTKFAFSDEDNDDAIKKFVLSCDCINGSPFVDITYDDLDPETQEDIDFGLTTLEDVIRDMRNNGSTRGEKISEIRLVKFGDGFTNGHSEDTAYTIADMNMKPGFVEENDDSDEEENTVAENETDDDDEDDLFDDIDI